MKQFAFNFHLNCVAVQTLNMHYISYSFKQKRKIFVRFLNCGTTCFSYLETIEGHILEEHHNSKGEILVWHNIATAANHTFKVMCIWQWFMSFDILFVIRERLRCGERKWECKKGQEREEKKSYYTQRKKSYSTQTSRQAEVKNSYSVAVL